MDTATPDAAVIIPHYNDAERLERCLSALMANDRTGVDILVVDNNSSQPLEALRAKFPKVRFVVEPEKGAAAARNRGVRETDAPLLFFIDADCVAAPNWLETARKVAPMADLIGGRVEVFDETPPPRSGAEGFEAVFAFHNRHYVETKGFSVTANLVTSRAVFEATGDFKNGVSEDFDWCQRAVAHGYSLRYHDELAVNHPSRSDWDALRRKWHRLTVEMFPLGGTGPAARLRWTLRALAMPVSALVHLPKVLGSPELDGAGERARAALTLIRLRCQRMFWMLRQAIGLSI